MKIVKLLVLSVLLVVADFSFGATCGTSAADDGIHHDSLQSITCEPNDRDRV